MPDILIATGNSSSHEIIAHFGVGQILIRRVSSQHLVKYDAQTPDITLGAVYVFPITLRTHIGWRAHIVKQLRLFGLIEELAEAKICNSGSSGC